MDFEKLEVWRLATELSVDVYRELKTLRDFGFKDQVTRASLSIPSNIAEGMTRTGSREKLHFLSIAKGSCSELRTQVYIGQRIDYIGKNVAEEWIGSVKRIASMLSGLMSRIKVDLDTVS